MIVYDLGCAQGHRFEGWFASGDDFARQNERELVRCPVCDDPRVAVVPTAKVRVARHSPAVADQPAQTPEAPTAVAEAMPPLPPEMLKQLRDIVRNTENVGRRFPEEARRIHYEEAPARPIRGQASPEEAESLRDEGIEFSSLPAFLTNESH